MTLHTVLSQEDKQLALALPEIYRNALLATEPYAERAVTQGVALGTIKSRVARARVMMGYLRQGLPIPSFDNKGVLS